MARFTGRYGWRRGALGAIGSAALLLLLLTCGPATMAGASAGDSQMSPASEQTVAAAPVNAKDNPATRATPCNGADIDGDGHVGLGDLGRMARQWLWTGPAGRIPADICPDGKVNMQDFACLAQQWLPKDTSVALFVDSAVYAALEFEIDRLAADIRNDLDCNVYVLPGEWQDIFEIKGILRNYHDRCGLLGALLIGDIPTSYFEYQDSGATPTDRFYQDLSDEFVDTDGDGRFEREYYRFETDITMRDIWTGRIKPPIGGAQGTALLRNYLDRNHAYRTGQLSYPRKMLYFNSVAINQSGMSEQDYLDLTRQIDEYTGLYDSDAQVHAVYDADMTAQKAAYLAALSQPYEFVFVNIHGSSQAQWLGGSVWITYPEVIDAAPQTLFGVLASCSNGDFTQTNYFAGWYLFAGQSLVVTANSAVTMLIGGATITFFRDYIPLAAGVTFGDMHLHDLAGMPTHLFGDPTLRLRPKPTVNVPEIRLDRRHIDFGDVVRGSKPQLTIGFENAGSKTAVIQYKKAPYSINGEAVILEYWDVFQYRHPDTGGTFRDFEIPAGQSKAVPFTFYPRADGPLGAYSMKMLFQTNDPKSPYLIVHLEGTAVDF